MVIIIITKVIISVVILFFYNVESSQNIVLDHYVNLDVDSPLIWSLGIVFILERINAILETFILSYGKDVVLKVSRPSISETKEVRLREGNIPFIRLVGESLDSRLLLEKENVSTVTRRSIGGEIELSTSRA